MVKYDFTDFCEPNDTWGKAHCSLASGMVYHAYISSEEDSFDWYYIRVTWGAGYSRTGPYSLRVVFE